MEKCNWGRAGFNDYGVVKREERNQPPFRQRERCEMYSSPFDREKEGRAKLSPPAVCSTSPKSSDHDGYELKSDLLWVVSTKRKL